MINKYAKFATNATVAAFILNLIAGFASLDVAISVVGIFSFIASIAGIILAIKGIKDFQKDKSIGGLGWCITAIVISLWMLIVSIIRILQAISYLSFH